MSCSSAFISTPKLIINIINYLIKVKNYLTFTENKYLANLQSVTYSIPNEFYQTTFDVKQAVANDSILIRLPSALREDPIDLSLTNQQYDPDLSLYQFSYTGSPIYDKWDTSIDFNNIDTPLNNNQLGSS